MPGKKASRGLARPNCDQPVGPITFGISNDCHLGTEGLGKLVEHNVDLAAYLARRCAEAPDFDVVPEVPDLSVVCFRHLPDGWARWSEDAVDDYQTRLQRALEVGGEAWVSTTVLRDRTFLRAGVVNYLSTQEDVDRLLAALRRHSEGVLEELHLR